MVTSPYGVLVASCRRATAASHLACLAAALCLLAAAPMPAQRAPALGDRRPADWLTDGGNPQRTAWQRDETILTTRNAKELRLLWKLTLDTPPREMHSLLPALVAGHVDTQNGPRQIVVVTGVSYNLYAIDARRGLLLWTKPFDHTAVGDTAQQGGPMCPGGITATPRIGPPPVPARHTTHAPPR